jgi:hypothetical protein
MFVLDVIEMDYNGYFKEFDSEVFSETSEIICIH